MFRKNIIKIINNLPRIIPGEVQGFYQRKFNEWISLKDVEKILESFKEEGLIKGSNRQGYENLQRFDCKCVKCHATFKGITNNDKMCYDCLRAISIPIEQEYIPTLKAQKLLNEATMRINDSKRRHQRIPFG